MAEATKFKKIPEADRVGVMRPVGQGEVIGVMVLSKDKSFKGFVGARSIQAVLSKAKPYAVIQRPKRQDDAADEAALQSVESIEE